MSSSTSQTASVKSKTRPQKKQKTYEAFNWREIPVPVVGLDEAGRGCLAGDVYAGAVVIPPSVDLVGVTDSKLLSAEAREKFLQIIQEKCQWAVGVATVEEIERLNILQASLLAMKRAYEGLKLKAQLVLIDGTFKVPGLLEPQMTLVKGELRATPIAAASIVAKVLRDRHMQELAKKYPQYGLEIHKGYATELHRQAIAQFGASDCHRKSFAGVREFVTRPKSTTL